MKTISKVLVYVLCALLVAACSKNPEDLELTEELTVPGYAKRITGMGNRVWHLTRLYENGLLKTLTPNQLTYKKTYTIGIGETDKGRFITSDNNLGSWVVKMGSNANSPELHETYDPPVVSPPVIYLIRQATPNMLDIEYKSNNITIREVYTGY